MALCLALCAGSLASAAPGAAASGEGRRALLVFAQAGESRFGSIGGLSVGILSASQGAYTPTQLLLDISQGARVATSAYPHSQPPSLSVSAQGAGAQVLGWGTARRRALAAPQELTPGLLAGTLGPSAYAGVSGLGTLDAIAAADAHGHIATFSSGSAGTLSARVGALLRGARLVVADLSPGTAGVSQLRDLLASRLPEELLIVVQRAPAGNQGQLLWSAAAGLPGGGGRELTSKTTQERGLVASFDIAPTILQWVGAKIPAEMRGRALEASSTLNGSRLRSLDARLRVIGGRRLKALGILLLAWVALLLASAPWPTVRARAIRAGALGVLWAPVAVMIAAAIEPSAGLEYAIIAIACLGLGALSDLLLPWPRAAIAPALAGPLAIVADALAHTQLLMRSLLGPNPILGARFYGVGNELKSGLAVAVLAALAGCLYPSARGWRAAAWTAAAGVVLAVIEGSERLGAGVGGVILVCAGFAVATVMLAPGRINRKRALIVLVSPVLGLVALAAIDLLTAHGSGHFTGSVLHARSPGDVRDILVRRYKAAWDELRNHAMPVATGLSLLCVWWWLRGRERLLAPVGGDPVWQAALAGGATAGIVGALVEDSGPVLLVVATFALGCVLSYLWAAPRASGSSEVT